MYRVDLINDHKIIVEKDGQIVEEDFHDDPKEALLQTYVMAGKYVIHFEDDAVIYQDGKQIGEFKKRKPEDPEPTPESGQVIYSLKVKRYMSDQVVALPENDQKKIEELTKQYGYRAILNCMVHTILQNPENVKDEFGDTLAMEDARTVAHNLNESMF